MKLHVYVGLFVILLLSAMPKTASADITFVSQAGLPLTSLTCDASGIIGCPTTSVKTEAHPLWEPDGTPDALGGVSGAVWISNDDSGYNGANFQPHHATWAGDSVNQAIFRLSLYFTNSAPSTINMSVWSDDTAGVYLDGTTLWAPVLSQNSTCSGATIGCLPTDGGLSSLALPAGSHVLTFEPYQVGTGGDTTSNPFGLLYKVTVTGNVTVPDGGVTLMLLGGVLVGLESLRRKLSA